METRKSAGIFTPAAAAVVDSRLALMKFLEEFCTTPYGILFCSA